MLSIRDKVLKPPLYENSNKKKKRTSFVSFTSPAKWYKYQLPQKKKKNITKNECYIKELLLAMYVSECIVSGI